MNEGEASDVMMDGSSFELRGVSTGPVTCACVEERDEGRVTV